MHEGIEYSKKVQRERAKIWALNGPFIEFSISLCLLIACKADSTTIHLLQHVEISIE